jgi:DNA-binding beta-propeller fold protein YncE
MGVVYLGRDMSGRRAAVKVVHAHLADDPAFRDRFTREIATARAVRAPWTAAVLAADARARRPWLATEFVDGPDLDRTLATSGPLPEPGLLQLAAAMFEALAALHAGGVVHRDIKPANVLLAPDGPRLIDFGIARALDATTLTSTGQAVGTPAYMSPEQATGEDTGPPSDVFSLAAVLTFAATGRGPFGIAPNPGAMLLRIADAEPDLTGVPQQLQRLLSACLAKDPVQRPAADQVAADLAGHRPPAPLLPRPDRVTTHRRSRWKTWAAPAAMALLTITAVVAMVFQVSGASIELARPVPTAGKAPVRPKPATVIRSVPVAGNPDEVAVDAGGRAYVATSDGVAVIDPTTGAVVTLIDAQGKPSGIAVDADAHKLFICSYESVAILDLPAASTADNVTIAGLTMRIAAAPAARRLFLHDNDRNVVIGFDMAAGAVTREIPASDVAALAVSPDGRSLWVHSQEADTWTVFDPGTGAVRATYPATTSSDVVAFGPDGARAYVEGGSDRKAITVIDTNAGTSLGEFWLDNSGSLRSLAVSPDGRYLFASMLSGPSAAPEILVIDTSSNVVVQSLEVDGKPDQMAVTSDGGTLYASDYDADRVFIIDIGGYR